MQVLNILYCMLVECAPLALPHAFAINNTQNTFAYTHVHRSIRLSGHKTKPYIYK